jgi:hypothetical protein
MLLVNCYVGAHNSYSAVLSNDSHNLTVCKCFLNGSNIVWGYTLHPFADLDFQVGKFFAQAECVYRACCSMPFTQHLLCRPLITI